MRLLNRVLSHFGLELGDWGGRVYVLRDRKGRTAVVDDLGGLWTAAERLAGRPLDPLDPTLVGALAPWLSASRSSSSPASSGAARRRSSPACSGRPELGETAVIVNELGEVAIDHHLLRRVDERTVLLGNGCLCCTLRGDLADELRDLLSRRRAARSRPSGACWSRPPGWPIRRPS